jgi:hypothetical protein
MVSPFFFEHDIRAVHVLRALLLHSCDFKGQAANYVTSTPYSTLKHMLIRDDAVQLANVREICAFWSTY